MAFLQLQSDNPQFTFLIRKNPASGMAVRQLRHGLLFGYYTRGDARQFNCWFRDSSAQVSYDTEKQFEFNDVTRYSAATYINHCFDEFFHELNVKDQPGDDAGYENSLLLNCIRAKQRTLEIFARAFGDFTLDYESIATGFFRVRIHTRRPLRMLLCFAGVLALLCAIHNRELAVVDDKQLVKFARFIRDLDAPYFVRYQFKANLIRRGATFELVREYLENDRIRLEIGHNFAQRQRFVGRNLTGDAIIDVGCGEGHYLRFARDTGQYFAIDREQACRQQVAIRAGKLELTNVTVLSSLGELPTLEGRVTVLLTEVLEHNALTDARELLLQCLLPGARVIVTTPNRDFNVHYAFDEDEDSPEDVPRFRHEGHVFEFNDAEFRAFILEATRDRDVAVAFHQIGDSVDGVSPQSAAIIDWVSQEQQPGT